MSVLIKLKNLIEEMEIQSEETRSFLNMKTGELVLVTLEDLGAAEDEEPFEHLPEWEKENRIVAIDVIENPEDYIELPNRYEINEYEMVENFCFTISDQRKQESLFNVIRGKGAFRRFKDKIIDFDIEDQWYTYRDECFKKIAIEWCKENKINFIE